MTDINDNDDVNRVQYRALWDLISDKEEESIRQFVRCHRIPGKRKDDEEDPIDVFPKVLASLFNDALRLQLRNSIWDFFQEVRLAKNMSQKKVASAVALAPSTYSKADEQLTLGTIAVLLRALDLELRDLRLPSHKEQTIAGLLAVVPRVKYDAFGHQKPSAQAILSREDVEWLLHLDVCGDVWLKPFLRRDSRDGSIVSAALAASIRVRLGGQPVQPRDFSDLVNFWLNWGVAWQMAMNAIPTGKHV